MPKTEKNDVKKRVKTGKSGNFQKVLKSSIRLQITFCMPAPNYLKIGVFQWCVGLRTYIPFKKR